MRSHNNILNNVANNLNEEPIKDINTDNHLNEVPAGVSIESASYIENNFEDEEKEENLQLNSRNEEEYTPKLFSEENSLEPDEIDIKNNDQDHNHNDELFDQDLNEEEDFEIPAFLRKQKF